MPQLSQRPELTNVQSQLLKMFAYDLPEEEWVDLQKMLARFFAQRVKQRTAKIWEERGYTNQTMDNWLNGEAK